MEGLDAPRLCRLKPKGVRHAFIYLACYHHCAASRMLAINLLADGSSGVDESVWTGWMAALGPLNGAEFCFSTVKRGTVWTAVYTKPTSPNTKLELVLDPSAPRWQVIDISQRYCHALVV